MWTRVVVAAALLLGGCGTQPSHDSPASAGSTGPGNGSEVGTIPVARLTDIVGSYDGGVLGQSPTPIVAGSTLRLQVLDRTIRLQAGCNTMSGAARVEDSHLVVEQLAMTEMACDPALMDQDRWLADRLTQRPRLDRSGLDLALVWDDGWLGFARAKDQVLPGELPSHPDEPVGSSPTTEPGPS